MQNAETILGSINHRRAACGESLQARFGGGPTEKARATGTSPAAYPTLRGLGGRKASWLPDRFRAGEYDRKALQRRLIPLQARLGRLLRRGEESPDRKAAGLCRELRKWWPALWSFARVEGVEPTNNGAERALRPAVLWRKGSFGSNSEPGSRFAERLLTVVASCRQQGRPLLGLLIAAGDAARQGTAAPSLLPTRPG
ncbi:MAG TPA: transposase [Candidatus Limnocylindria bacterium]|nr:transposase [Candidatus Limnocylindria bacterium]